jgi:mannose PTS system EIIC component
MLPEWGPFLLLVLLGAWTGVDTTSVGQFMISRPVVAATLAGWVVGDPVTGALLGLILEALNLMVLPVGAARYPESGPSAVAASAVLVLTPATPWAFVTAVVFALSWAWAGGATVRYLRLLNMRLVPRNADVDDAGRVVERRHLLAMVLDFARAALLTAVGMLLLTGLFHLTPMLNRVPESVAQVALWSLVAAGTAATLRLFSERRAVLFGLGAVGGLLLIVLL